MPPGRRGKMETRDGIDTEEQKMNSDYPFWKKVLEVSLYAFIFVVVEVVVIVTLVHVLWHK